ncbi:MAG: TlpA family protein disulfide reductase [Calditrichaeota bacterium]|nr:TlpA family protein disulfide reductase [Calditrichota bacterium]MCB9366494.1 TlpA family protein disulfide reductase [Calditrichota bacterium]MCB9391248.1 TlpA family protein disulfide reductase [Calditrichota bacterium]
MKTSYAILLTLALLSAAFAGRNWSLTQVQGGEFSITDHSGGKPSLLIFWATWCKPCKAEMDAMKETFDDLNARGLNVILISEDTQKSMSRVKPFLDSKGYTWTALLDPDGAVLKLYGGTSIPFTVMLDAQGTPVYEHRGELKDPSEMIAKANQLIDSASD